MFSLKQSAIVLIAALMLTSCANSTPPGSVPPTPLPAEYAAQCPDPVAAADNSVDATAVALKAMYDLYGICAGRLVDLVNWITAPKPTQEQKQKQQ